MVLAAALLFALVRVPATIHVSIDGVDREAVVYPPSHLTSSKPPVLFAFHGHGGSAARMNNRAHLETLWPEAIVIYPQGLPTVLQDPTQNGPGWILDPQESNRDINLYDALRKQALDQYNGDPDHVFAFGFSNGAMFMYTLWNLRGKELAGLGSSEGCMLQDMKLTPAKPFFITISSDDKAVPVELQTKTLDQVKTTNRSVGEDTTYEGQLGIGDRCTLYKGEQPVVLWSFTGGHEYPLNSLPTMIRFFSDQCKQG